MEELIEGRGRNEGGEAYWRWRSFLEVEGRIEGIIGSGGVC